MTDDAAAGAGAGDPVARPDDATWALAAARLSSLRQAVEVAAGERVPGWSELPDQVLLDQGHASAATGHALATRMVPVQQRPVG